MAIYFSFVFLISQSCPESRLDGPKCKVCREEVLLSCSFFSPFTLCSLWSFLVAKFNNRVCFAKRQMSSLHLIVLRVMKHFHPTWKVQSTFNCFACNQTFPFNVESPNFISSELKKGVNFKIQAFISYFPFDLITNCVRKNETCVKGHFDILCS